LQLKLLLEYGKSEKHICHRFTAMMKFTYWPGSREDARLDLDLLIGGTSLLFTPGV
jgi:hypothetical protein